jgi:hypothetical protein
MNHDQSGAWYRRDARMNLLLDAVVATLQRIGVDTSLPWWATEAIPTVEIVQDVGQLAKNLPALFVKVDEVGPDLPMTQSHEADVTIRIGCHTMNTEEAHREIWRLVEDVQYALASDPGLQHLADYYVGGVGVSPPSQMALGGAFQMSAQAESSSAGGDAGRGYAVVTLKATVLWQQAWQEPVHAITASMSSLGGGVAPPGALVTPASASLATGGHQAFTFTIPSGYLISDVLADGVSLFTGDITFGQHSSYTFTNVTGDHTLAVVFASV